MNVPASASRSVVVMQPYVLPYRNYLGLIRRCDEFIVFDDVQFCHRWQQRNCIPNGRGGKEWLTIPVVSRRPERQRICDVRIAPDPTWRRLLLERVEHVYRGHPCFDEVFPGFEQRILAEYTRLVDLSVALLQWITVAAGVRPPAWRWASEFGLTVRDRNERLIELCRAVGATHYVSGPAAKVYLRADLFAAAGIQALWHEDVYDPYPQAATQSFDHCVSVLDLLMNHGARSHLYVRPRAAGTEPAGAPAAKIPEEPQPIGER